MAIKFEQVKAGDELTERRRKRGRVASFTVKIVAIDYASGSALVIWNGNRPETWLRREVEKLYRDRVSQ